FSLNSSVKTVFTILFGVLLVMAQSLTSNGVPTPAPSCSCTCPKQCCVRRAPAPPRPDSPVSNFPSSKRLQLTVCFLSATPAQHSQSPVALRPPFPSSSFSSSSPLYQRNCSLLI